MDESIRLRCLSIAAYMIEHQSTVRQAAKAFHISKSSVHKDMGERLPHIDRRLAEQVAALLNHNKAVRHLRGGAATRQRYLEQKHANACNPL